MTARHQSGNLICAQASRDFYYFLAFVTGSKEVIKGYLNLRFREMLNDFRPVVCS